MTDKDLLLELQTNPNRAMDYVLNQYTGLVYCIIHSKISSVGTVEDIKECVSDVFMEFYQKATKIDLEKGSIKGYIAIMAKHKGIDLYRRLVSVTCHNCDMDESCDQLADNKFDPEENVMKKEQRKLLLQAIQALGEPDREIFIRKYYLGQKTKEIADILFLRDNTVDKKISRGLKKLRVMLGGVVHEGV